MVTNCFRILPGLSVAFVCSQVLYASESPARMVSADIVQHSSLTIKPCQTVTVVIEVKVEQAVEESHWRRIAHQISQTVRVNGREFRNRLSSPVSSLNDAADFRLCENRVSINGVRDGNKCDRRQIIATMFVNGADRECLFSESGRYQVEFVVGNEVLTLEVHVEEPTSEEHNIIEAISDVPVLLFLMDPEDSQYANAETLTLIESLVQHDTAYKKMLSLARGVAPESTRFIVPPTSPDFQEKRVAAVRARYEWLAPFCSDEITSRLQATAALKCGLFAGILAAHGSQDKQAAEYLAQRNELWHKVAASPMAFGEAARANEYLDRGKAEKREGNAPKTRGQDRPN